MKVTMLIAARMSHEDIATAIGISAMTLELRYRPELRSGHAHRRAEVIELLWGQARKGNTAATKHLDAITSVASAETAFDQQDAPKPARLGKKEQAALDAATAGAGSEWAEDLGPIPPGAAAH